MQEMPIFHALWSRSRSDRSNVRVRYFIVTARVFVGCTLRNMSVRSVNECVFFYRSIGNYFCVCFSNMTVHLTIRYADVIFSVLLLLGGGVRETLNWTITMDSTTSSSDSNRFTPHTKVGCRFVNTYIGGCFFIQLLFYWFSVPKTQHPTELKHRNVIPSMSIFTLHGVGRSIFVFVYRNHLHYRAGCIWWCWWWWLESTFKYMFKTNITGTGWRTV